MTPHPHETTSRYAGAIPDDLLAELKSHIEALDVPVTATDGGLRVVHDHSALTIRQGPRALDVAITAETEAELYQSREAVIWLLGHVFPQGCAAMTWSGAGGGPRLPPNFRFAEVRRVERVAPRFLRLEMACADIASLMTGAMHFSLLLPPADRAPQWPMVNEKGLTVWPVGEATLHRAAYTFVDFDPAAGTFTFDVFEHEGGPTTTWARAVRPGETVGITGPGGGGLPDGDVLLIGGDETAIPAIRRILAASPANRTGAAVIETADADSRCPLDHPPGMTVEWTVRGDGPGLWPRMSALLPTLGAEPFVWCAAEQEVVREARQDVNALGLPKSRLYLKPYWSR